MNKIKILCLSLLGLFFGLSYSNAGQVIDGTLGTNISLTTSYVLYSFGDSTHCILNSQVSRTADYKIDNVESVLSARSFICLTGDVYLKASQSFNLYEINVSDLIVSCDYSGYVLESDITENYCTNKFSDLISESDITSSYCETQFDLISPSDCPSSGTGSGSGDISRSSFWVNDRQILGGANIYLYIPDWLDWSYTYIDQNLQVEVVNQGDEDYINDILTIQEYHPNNQDFIQSFIGGLTLILPYIIIVLFIVFVWRIIRKIFK